MKFFLRIFLYSFLILIIVLAGSSYYSYHWLVGWSETPQELEEPHIIELRRGMSLPRLSENLKDKGVVDHAFLFRLWVRYFSDFAKFQAGPYMFEVSVSPREIAAKMIGGDVHMPVILQIAVPEGFTARKVFDTLLSRGIGEEDEYKELLSNKELLKKFNIPSPSLEGYLYPATYPFIEMPSPEEALSTMLKAFWDNLPANYEESVNKMGLTLHEAVTFASLIELETSQDDEREMVSEVIWNRLKRPMSLGIDAAVIYGIEDYDGRIRFSHLRDASNPYNTRIHPGLPPTPIGSPSRKSLLAVLNPTSFGNYYYVVDANDMSRHRFSKTLQEHNRNVRDLVRVQRGG